MDTLDDFRQTVSAGTRTVWGRIGPEPDPNFVTTLDRDRVAQICRNEKEQVAKARGARRNEYFLDATMASYTRRNGTAKRMMMTLNYAGLHNNKSVIEQLITPEDLRKAWETTQPKGGCSARGALSPLSPLSQP